MKELIYFISLKDENWSVGFKEVGVSKITDGLESAVLNMPPEAVGPKSRMRDQNNQISSMCFNAKL